MDILIEEKDGSLWAAALKDGRLEGLEVDPAYEEVRWGSVYWAKVKTIDAALDAVYVDLDGENTGILYNSDVRLEKDGKIIKGGAEAIGKQFQPGDMVAVQAKTAYTPGRDDGYLAQERKIPQVSMDITLPGRYLIYCPTLDCNRISMRISDKKLRTQIQKMMDEMADIEGCILRSAAANTQTDILVREGKILHTAWQQMSENFEGDSAQLIMLGPDAIQRTLSDQAGQLIDTIEIVTMEHYNYVEEWCSIFAPDLITKIEPIELDDASEDLALFHYRDIIGQIENLFESYAFLTTGGNIIIQNTAALCAVDVNKSGDKRSNLACNIDAAREVARQLRLRNIGGIIVIDFLDFKGKTDEKDVLAALENAVLDDPCTVQIHGKTRLGLVEITRKRRTPPLEARLDIEELG